MKGTYTTTNTEILTIEDLKRAATAVNEMEEAPLKNGLGWFTKLMNRFGWHRKYEVIVFDRSKFGCFYPPKVSSLIK